MEPYKIETHYDALCWPYYVISGRGRQLPLSNEFRDIESAQRWIDRRMKLSASWSRPVLVGSN